MVFYYNECYSRYKKIKIYEEKTQGEHYKYTFKIKNDIEIAKNCHNSNMYKMNIILMKYRYIYGYPYDNIFPDGRATTSRNGDLISPYIIIDLPSIIST